MKKVLLIAAIAVCSLKASAQTEQGNILLGGSVNYTSTKSDADDAEAVNTFSIMPQVGYFVADNIAVGTGIGYMSIRTDFPVVDNVKLNAFAIAPFGRYYKSISDQFKFFGQLAVPMAFGTLDADADEDLKTTSVGVSLSPGFAFFPTKKFGIELGFSGISYTNTKVKFDGEEIEGAGSDTFSIGADFFSPQIGLSFYF